MNRKEFLKKGIAGVAAIGATALFTGNVDNIIKACQATPSQSPNAGNSVMPLANDMQYRDFGKTGCKISAIGYGMMRLPMRKDNSKEIDVELSKKIVRYAIDHGVNYIDTAYNYIGGKCEGVTGEILQDGYREKVYLATKFPVWKVEKESDFDEILNEQLTRLRTDHIDFYMLHSLGRSSWEKVKKFNLLEKMEKAKADGRVRHIGFSFHDNIKLFKEILETYTSAEFCYLQLNYKDVEYQAGLEGLRLAAARGMGVVAMEPLRGGFLASVPDSVREIFEAENPFKTPVEWAFDFLWNLPELSLCISGMNSLQQVSDNIHYAERSSIGMFSDSENETIKKVQDKFASFNTISCTGCSYCQPCPVNINIPDHFEIYNNYKIKDDLEQAKFMFSRYIGGNSASKCIHCMQCENICPQHIKITEWLPKIAETFS